MKSMVNKEIIIGKTVNCNQLLVREVDLSTTKSTFLDHFINKLTKSQKFHEGILYK